MIKTYQSTAAAAAVHDEQTGSSDYNTSYYDATLTHSLRIAAAL